MAEPSSRHEPSSHRYLDIERTIVTGSPALHRTRGAVITSEPFVVRGYHQNPIIKPYVNVTYCAGSNLPVKS